METDNNSSDRNNAKKLDGDLGEQTLTNNFYDEKRALAAPTSISVGKAHDGFSLRTSNVELSNFLRRPWIYSSGAITTTSPAVIMSLTTPEDIISNPLYSNKLRGYLGFRATLVVKVQVNATPFQQGLFVLAYYPELQHKANIYVTDYEFVQLPHVMLDIGTEGEAELRIPHISVLPFYDRLSHTGGVGIFKLITYGSFKTGTSSTTCGYTVWVSFDDIVMDIPTAQGGLPSEKEATTAGPIAIGLSKVSATAGILGRIPALAPIAKPVSWVTSILSGAANIWGLAKPLNVDTISRMNRLETGYDPNVDGPENARSLALFSSPAVTVDDSLFDDVVDQMSISYVVQKYGYVSQVSWLPEYNAGHLLYSVELSPRNMCFNRTSRVLKGPTPVCYLNELFTYYKGSLVFKLRFVKTKFHSGRILIAYQPGTADGVTTDFSYEETAYLCKDIVDLRECNTYEFTCPYANTRGYTSTFDPYGLLKVFVLDKLVGPETCSSSIEMIVEARGAPDFEFALPNDGYKTPLWKVNPEYVATAQSGFCEEPAGLGGSSINSGAITSQFCIGEQVLSLKQLCLRTSLYYEGKGEQQNSEDNFYYLAVDPFINYGRLNTSVNSGAFSALGSDIISLIAPMYNMMRGGMILRLRYKNIDDACFVTLGREGISSDIANESVSLSYGLHSIAGDVGFTKNRQGCLYPRPTVSLASVATPQYSRSAARLVAPGSIQDGSGGVYGNYGCLNVYSTPISVRYEINPYTTSSTKAIFQWSLLRQAADDFHLGFFTCCPNLLLSAVLVPS